MKKTFKISSIIFIIMTFASNVFAISKETFTNNYITTLLGCFAIATAMTFVYLNAIKEADKNAKKFQKENAKKELEEKKAKEVKTKESKKKENKTKEKKKTKGMSLLVLLITIIVMIIIAGVVIFNVDDSNILERSTDAEISGILDNVQHRVSEVVSAETLETKCEAYPTDMAFSSYFTRVAETDYFKVNLEALDFVKVDTQGFFIIDEEFNVIYLEDEDYIFPEDTEVPQDVIDALVTNN